MNKTKVNRKIKLKIRIGSMIRSLGRLIAGNYWVCITCGQITFEEEDIMCWNCNAGEMIYQGKI